MCVSGGYCKGQGRSTGSPSVSNCRGGVGMLPERDGWGGMASGGPHAVVPAPRSCRRCCHAHPACTTACGNSVSFQVRASPSPLAVCNRRRAQMAWPVSLLFISRLCLPVAFAALILMKRGRAGRLHPFPKPRSFSLSTARTFGFHLPSPLSPPLFFCMLHFLF